MHHISGLQVLIWDFDGTLYKQKPALWDDIRASEIRTVMEHTGWSEEKAKEEFYKVYKIETPSGTKTVSRITGISNTQSAAETGQHVNYEKYLEKDQKLITMFAALKRYRHFMLVNGTQTSVTNGLSLLGVDKEIFEEIVTSEVMGESKPGEAGYRYILQKTGLPSEVHCMIGDREQVDLVTAKRLGMRTCLVWTKEKSLISDVTLPSVYDIVNIL